jgi:hypothetical protein
MANIETKAYRIPLQGGRSYYRQGRRYEPGDIVHLPKGEVPGGWEKLEDGTMRPKIGAAGAHAWREIIPGKKEVDENELSELERARNDAKEQASKAAEAERRLAELEAQAEDTDKAEPATEEEEQQPEGGKRKGRRRASDESIDE